MVSDDRREELRKFLRDRRAAVSPREAGLPETGRRRTPGLRREEVAQLAGVSVTWYTWLEQGRDIQCSMDLLRRLSGALRLSVTDTDYLFRLAGHSAPIRAPGHPQIDPSIQGVLDGFTTGPALVMSPRLDVVAFNALADAVFGFDAISHPFARNQLWRGFTDETRRHLYLDWEELMSQGVGMLRANYAARIGDEDFEKLIEVLSESSADFVRLWEQRHTQLLYPTLLRFLLPNLGELNFLSTRMSLLTVADHVTFFLAPTDDETRHKILLLSGASNRRNTKSIEG